MKRVNLIPMAGLGIRFVNAGYNIPKPLLDVNGLPMIIKSAQCLPDADKWIFVCRKEHLEKTNLEKILKFYFQNVFIIEINYLTEGQLSTCLIAEDYFTPDDLLTIGSCDNGMEYNIEEYSRLITEHDALVWTFRQNPTVLNNPNIFGWAKVNRLGLVSSISCKSAISSNPINDHALTGAFTFKKAGIFLDCAKEVIKKDRRINNEFYVDTLIDECAKVGYHVFPFDIDNYFCWGTPKDLQLYLEQYTRG